MPSYGNRSTDKMAICIGYPEETMGRSTLPAYIGLPITVLRLNRAKHEAWSVWTRWLFDGRSYKRRIHIVNTF